MTYDIQTDVRIFFSQLLWTKIKDMRLSSFEIYCVYVCGEVNAF